MSETSVLQYARTKQLSEELVLSASGCSLRGRQRLRTSALRLGFVYGPHEQRHLPRMIRWVRCGGRLTRAGFALDERQDMVHVDNAADAHARAVERLLDEDEDVDGQAFNITDDNPQNTYLFFLRHMVRCSR